MKSPELLLAERRHGTLRSSYTLHVLNEERLEEAKLTKTHTELLAKVKKDGGVWVDSDKVRQVKAIEQLVASGQLVHDKSKVVRSYGMSSRYYVAK